MRPMKANSLMLEIYLSKDNKTLTSKIPKHGANHEGSYLVRKRIRKMGCAFRLGCPNTRIKYPYKYPHSLKWGALFGSVARISI